MTQLKAYLSIDDLAEEEIPAFQQLTAMFFVEYSLVNIRSSKRLYIGLIRNSEDIPSFLEAIKTKNPEVLGVFEHSGVQWGQTVEITPATYDEDTGEVSTEEITTISGEAIYPFDLKQYLELMPDELKFDEEGKITSTSRPTEFKALKNFGGWGECIFPQM